MFPKTILLIKLAYCVAGQNFKCLYFCTIVSAEVFIWAVWHILLLISFINWHICSKRKMSPVFSKGIVSHTSLSLFSFKKNQGKKFVKSQMLFILYPNFLIMNSSKEKKEWKRTMYFLMHVYIPSPGFNLVLKLWKALSFPINMCLPNMKFTKTVPEFIWQ